MASSSSYPSSNSNRPMSFYETASRAGSISSRRSIYETQNDIYEAEDDLPVGHHFTFIPPNPKKYYKRLVEYCLLVDLEVMLSPEVDDNDEVSLGILSHPHLELINECALRWRIGHPYRVSCFLDLVRQFYERNEVPMECVPEALAGVIKAMQDTTVDFWMLSDVSSFEHSYRPPEADKGTIRSYSLIISSAYMAVSLTSFSPLYTIRWTLYPISKLPMSFHMSNYWSNYEKVGYWSVQILTLLLGRLISRNEYDKFQHNGMRRRWVT